MKLKIIVNYIIFIVVTILIAIFVSKLIYRNTHYYEANLLKTIYTMKSNSVDVLVIGPSTTETGCSEITLSVLEYKGVLFTTRGV